MCKKLIYLISFVLLLGLILTGVATAAESDLLGWWPLDGSTQDMSGNGNDLQLSGGADFVEGYFGEAVYFDGIDGNGDSVHSSGDIDLLDPGSDSFTVTVWIKHGQGETSQNYKFVVSKGNPTSARVGWSIWVNTSLASIIVRCNSSDTSAQRASQQHAWRPNEWVHVAMVIDREAAQVRGYLNGTNEGWIPGGGGPTSDSLSVWGGIANDLPLVIGHRSDGLGTLVGVVDDLRIYTGVLTEADMQQVMVGTPPGLASNASPADEATDVPRDVVLSWTSGEFANTHDVYFGESFEDVNTATTASAEYKGNQTGITYALDRLDFGQSYYWRVDEVNAPPTSHVVFKGEVWSFIVEPVAYAIENIAATASSGQPSRKPENTINGSGLDEAGLLHGKDGDHNMWLSDAAGPQPTWIEFQLDKVYKLHEMWVWNYNEFMEPLLGMGFKDVTIEYSVNGTDYTTLGTTHQFAQAPGTSDYAHNTTVDFGGLTAKYVRLTANSNWGGLLPQYGLSEVRFLHIPVRAREPSPDSGATDVDVDVTLGFRAGREAAQHDVYFGSDEQAVIDGNVPVTTVPETSYCPLSLDLAQTYYWKVSEVNIAESPTTWEGDVWNFATPEFLVVDDFESYNNLDPDEPESKRIFSTWIDGYEQPANGSLVGYAAAPFAEQSIVHSGSQSMPLFYDNSGTASYSEAELTLSPPQDWTKNGITALSLWFSGDPNNIPDQMYVKINGSKVTYDGDADNLARIPWQPWNINLASLGIDLQSVTKFSIGFGDETSMMPGGSGKVFVDDIRLYLYSRQLATPAEPAPGNLVAYWQFEGNANDSSGNGLHGTIMGAPTFVAGKVGQAISLDGFNDFVEITGYKGILGPNAVTVTAWINTTTMLTGTIVGWGPNVDGQRFGFRINDDRIRMENAGGNIQGDSNITDGQWHHVAVTVQAGATISYPDVILYVDGIDDTRASTDPDAFDLTADQDVRIGSRPASNDRFFMGQIDDVRIYDRALTAEEIAWLAGRIEPFDEPF